MFGVSLPELIIIFAVILIVFGPDKLPSAARAFGKFMGELKKGSDAVRREFYNSVYTPADEIRKEIDYASRDIKGVKDALVRDLSDAQYNPTCEDKPVTPSPPPSDEKSGTKRKQES